MVSIGPSLNPVDTFPGVLEYAERSKRRRRPRMRSLIQWKASNSLLEKTNSAHDISDGAVGLNSAKEASAGAKTYADSVANMAKMGEESPTARGFDKMGKVLAPVNAVLGVKDAVTGAKDIQDHGASPMNVADTTRGVVETGGAVATVLGASSVAAAAGAGVMAYDATAATIKAADDPLYAGGWGDKKNETAEQRAVDAGRWVDAHTGDHNPDHPSVLGGVTATVATGVMAPIGAAQNVYNRAIATPDMSAVDHPYAGLSGPVIQAAQQGWAAAPPGMDTQPAPSFSAKDLGITDNSVGKSPVPQAPAQQSGSNPQKRSAAAAMADVDAMMKQPLTIGGSG